MVWLVLHRSSASILYDCVDVVASVFVARLFIPVRDGFWKSHIWYYDVSFSYLVWLVFYRSSALIFYDCVCVVASVFVARFQFWNWMAFGNLTYGIMM